MACECCRQTGVCACVCDCVVQAISAAQRQGLEIETSKKCECLTVEGLRERTE